MEKEKQGCLTLSFYCVININITRLYEQGADSVRIGQYVLKWVQWVRAALQSHIHKIFDSKHSPPIPLPAGFAKH